VKENRLRVLVIEGDPDRVQLLEEAFGEMEELRFSKPANPACTRDYALDWREALDRVGPAPDAILLGISHDCEPSAPAALCALRAAAPSTALIVMSAREDEAMAVGLIRMGAQDYLIETEIDCTPLARVLRCAVERSRLDWSRQSMAMVDDLAGLYNGRGVMMLSERDDRLAAALHLRRWSVELRMDDDDDLRRIELAEQLNELAAAGLLAGRAANDDFVLYVLAPTGPAANESAGRAARQLVAQCTARGIAVRVRVSTEAVRESMS
jgi:DNA-binding NarL/FixJ family response regulator